ncbi:histidine phosphatase family protein [Clostridium hydrogenum]|uniref:histidine phosphatase family protein n=1 Tax=Clostridium hydrogenum TaxID=2855764 RepID=UPI001F212BD7|nr:histidine phosphatase family protein [Clostridium hydrogenum]
MGNKVTFYLMRHGQTIINKAGRVQGWCDGVLTDEGIEAAKDAAVGLRDIEFKAAYSSDLHRAVKTARIIMSENKASENLKLEEMPELREVYCGKYEGEIEKIMFTDIMKYLNVSSFSEIRSFSDFEKSYIDSCAALDETGQAEDYDTLIKRVMSGLNIIGKENSQSGGGNILLVVHGGMLRALLKAINKDLCITDMDNCCVSKLEYDNGKFKVLSINDKSYKERGEKLRKSN